MKAATMNPAAAFTDAKVPPTDDMMKLALGNDSFADWHLLETWLRMQFPGVDVHWAYSHHVGWYAVPTIKKRRICYFLPRRGDYELRMILGDKALAALKQGPHAKTVASLLSSVKHYPEGTAFDFNQHTWRPEVVCALLSAKMKA